jgi:hypothetical protein
MAKSAQQSAPTGKPAQQSAPAGKPGWTGGDWRNRYQQPGGGRWSDRIRAAGDKVGQGRSSEIRDWVKQRMRTRDQEEAWRGEMLANTGPADRQQAQEWMRNNPNKTMEGQYDPDTWQYAVQQYQQRPGPGSLFELPSFQRYRTQYGITPPGPGHMRV